MFGFGKKKKPSASNEQKDRQISAPSAGIKGSLISLEQRLMFDAAASATASEVASEQVAQEQAEAAVSSDHHADGPSAEQTESQGLLDAIATYNPGESRSEVVFVDPTVPNYQDLLGGMNSNVEVIMLDGGQDGIEQMANALSDRTGIDAIHVISHGEAGALQLGTGVLNADSMSTQYADDLAVIQQSLSDQADILVYGCEFAQGEAGQAAVDLLAQLTGADVQASNDLTGSISLGGDWEFEVSTGSIETSLAISYDAQMNWAEVLGNETVADTFSDKSYGNNDGTSSWSSNWSEVDVGKSDVNGGHIQVNSGELRIQTQVAGASVSRGVDLSGASSAKLSFDYNNELNKGGSVEVRISTDGGKTYGTLGEGVFSKENYTGSGTASFDISEHMAADTKIQFVVTGTSGGDRLFIDNVQVDYNVADANRAPTEITLKGNTVAENAVKGTVVGTAAGSDADAGDKLSYSLTDTAGGRFAIDASTGVITVADGSLLNYEAATSHSLTVRVTDAGGLSVDKTFSIGVSNVNEAPTEITLKGNTVAENAVKGTVVGTAAGSDADAGDKLSYSLTDTAGGRFAINASTGVITVADGSLLNAEASTGHSVTVRVTDAGGLTVDKTFSIGVSNVNEAPTDLSLSANSIAENAATGTVVGTVTGTDPDARDTKTYSLTDTAGGRFAINASTGQLTVANGSLLNYEGATSHNLTVRVTDSGGLTYDETFTIHLTNVVETYVVSGNSTLLAANGPFENVVIKGGYVEINGDAEIHGDLTITNVARINGGELRVTGDVVTTDTDYQGSATIVLAGSGAQTISTGAGAGELHRVSIENTSGLVTVSGNLQLSGNYTDNGNAVDATKASVTLQGNTVVSGAGTSFGDVTISGGYLEIKGDMYVHGDLSLTNAARINGGVIYVAGEITIVDRNWHGTAEIRPWVVNEAPTDLALSANSVAENATTGTVVGIVTGTDPDARDTKTYSLTDTAGGRFAINASTGQLTVADGSLLNYEAATSHTIAVRVTDSGGQSYTESFTINLSNVNEAPTEITLKGNSVAENAVKGTVVGTAAGSDADAGDKLSYSLTDTAGGRFAIDASTGVITVADGSLLNYEAATSHSLTVRVTDAGGLSVDKTFSIGVSNVNEAPTDLSLSTNSVAENATTGTVVGTVSGTDPDAGDTKTYSLTDTAGGRFAINASTGVITVADGSLLNYEAATSHSLTVRVTDSGGQSYRESFTINLTNVNEGPTDLNLSANSVVENAATGTVVGTVSGTDPDAGDTKTYSLTDTAGGRFAINASTGVITVADGSLLNYEAASSHNLTVQVTDSGGQSYTEQFTINLTNVNEGPTDLALSANSVAENATTGTVVGTVTGTDPDAGDTKTYSLTDTAGGRFAINASTGVITVADGSLLNYESAASHSLTVRVTDSAGQSYTEQFTINLTNVNEGPTDLALSANSVAENATTGTVVGTVTGTDPDAGDTKTYSLTDTAGGRFAINASTGVITVADGSLLNYEANASHNLTVQVTDSGGQSYTESFTINLTNVNEGPTDLALSANSVAENAATGTVVGTVSGTDPDAGDTKTYSLTDTAGGRFAINASTGVITVADGSLLNYEANASHNLTVQVTDSGGQSYTEQFTINLTNVNEGPTDLALSANSVAENATTGTVVGTVTGTDPDAGDTKTYGLTDTAGGRFAIDASTGEITVADGSLLDYESAASHTIMVQVTDAGGQSYTEQFTINLTNVNEGPTDLALSANSVAENATTGTVVGTVSGTDPDAGDTKTYSLTDTAGGRFAINASTGEITVADGSLLNYEAASSHTLTVQVTDSGGQSYTEQFTINLTNVNEGPTGADATVTLTEDTSHTLSTANFGFSDVDAGDSLSAVRIDTLPTAGTLTLSGGMVTAGQVVSVADITAGRLVFSPAADANETGYASVTFSVRDSHSTYDTTPNTLVFNVTAVNDAPTDLVLSTNSVVENAATGTVVGTISGTDPDASDTKTYSLTDTAGGRFAINASTGVIMVADGSLLNYESAASHNLTVQVTDSGGQSYTESFTINLTNVNEGPTDLALSANSVAENATTGTVVGTVSGTDPDAGDTKTYSLTDTAGGRFAINASTGVITVADGSLLNYESAASHTITVQVTDAGGLTHDQTFTINLTNVNEASPEVDGGDGGEQTLVASLFQKSPAGPEAVQPLILSLDIEGDTGSKPVVADELLKPVEWDAQAVPPVDILTPSRNVLDSAYEWDENQTGGLGTKGNASTSSGQQDEIAGNLESTNAAPADPGQVSWPSAGETEQIRDDSEGFAKTMVAGLVGAALQGTVRKKERMTTMQGELLTGDQEDANEQTSREPSPDEKEAPPNAA